MKASKNRIRNFLCEKKELQNLILAFLDSEDDDSYHENFKQLMEYLSVQKIDKDQQEIIYFLHLISKITKNHQRKCNFREKVEKILFSFDIKQIISKEDITFIFKRNLLILLILYEKQIITINDINQILDHSKKRYCYRFNTKIFTITKEEDSEFEEKRQKGENDTFLAQLIRNDSVEEFIQYTNQTNIKLSTVIQPSIYETNLFLNKNKANLIEYAAFYGSIQIFQYLLLNGAELTSSLWLYSIHSNCADMIHLLEENKIQPDDRSYEMCLKEAIKCHHNEIAHYIQDVLYDTSKQCHFFDDPRTDYKNNIKLYGVHYYNYAFFPYNFSNGQIIMSILESNHWPLVKILLKERMLTYMTKIIFKKKNFFYDDYHFILI